MKRHPISFTFDLEDHRPDHDSWPPRYPELTERVLDWMDERHVTGTVFIVGEVGQRHPELVRMVADRGHEIGLHNWQHIQLTAQTPDDVRANVRRGKAVLEDLSGTEVVGFRAPTGSLTPRSRWAIDILLEEGYQYSSSIMPGSNPLNCFPGAPEQPFTYANGLAEFPASIVGTRFFAFPLLGGTYIRVIPKPVLAALFRFAPRHPGDILYCHPYDFDPDEPFWWVDDVGRLAPLLWVGRKGMFSKLAMLVADGVSGTLRDQLPIARRGPVFDPDAPAPNAWQLNGRELRRRLHIHQPSPAPTG